MVEKSIVVAAHTWFPQHQTFFNLLQPQLPYKIEYIVLSKQELNMVWEPVDSQGVAPSVVPGLKWYYVRNDGDWGTSINPSIFNRVRKLEPAVVITKGWANLAYLVIQGHALRKHVPIITWMCGRDNRFVQTIKGGLLRGVSNAIAREVIRNSRFVFAYGTRAKADALELGASEQNVIIVRQTIDEDYFDFKAHSEARDNRQIFRRTLSLDDRPLFLCISQLIPRKGIRDLLQAFTELRQRRVDAQLLLIGQGSMRPLVQDYAEQNRGHFVWLPSVPYEKVPLYYAISDCFVFPTHFDAWGFVINESHCGKLPVVSSDAAHAAADLIKHAQSGLVYKAGDTQALCQQMEYAVEHSSEMQAMAQAAYNFIKAEWNQDLSARIWTKYIRMAIEENNERTARSAWVGS